MNEQTGQPIYKGIEITIEGNSTEPVNYVGVHPLVWNDHPQLPEMGFVETEVYSTEFILWLCNRYTFLKATQDFVINYPYLDKNNDYRHFGIEELFELYIDIRRNPFQNDIIDVYDDNN